MKKPIFIFVLAVFFTKLSCFSQETLTITTYYPSPAGAYKTIDVSEVVKLSPHDVTGVCEEGDLFYDTNGPDGSAGLYYCDGSPTPTPRLIGAAVGGSLWIASGEHIYRDTGNVGIGIDVPGAKLHVTDSNKKGLKVVPEDDAVALAFDDKQGGTSYNLRLGWQKNNFSSDVGIGVNDPASPFDVQREKYASSGLARGVNFEQALIATANNDALTALRIAPTFNPQTYTGVKNYGLIVESGNVGFGTIAPTAALSLGNNSDKTIQIEPGSSARELTIKAGGIKYSGPMTPSSDGGTLILAAGESSGPNDSKIEFRTSHCYVCPGCPVDACVAGGVPIINSNIKKMEISGTGDLLVLADKCVDSGYPPSREDPPWGSTSTTYFVNKKRYHVEATKAIKKNTINLDMDIMRDLCRDADGCSITIGMRDWDNTRVGLTASRGPYRFFMSETSNWWRISNIDTEGRDGDSNLGHPIYIWDSCYFTDGEYINGTGTDTTVQLGFMNWESATSYNDPDMVCTLTVDD